MKFNYLTITLSERGAFCACCGENLRAALTFDHITPRAHGGSNEQSNIQLLCLGCNALKGDGTECLHMREARALVGRPTAAFRQRNPISPSTERISFAGS